MPAQQARKENSRPVHSEQRSDRIELGREDLQYDEGEAELSDSGTNISPLKRSLCGLRTAQLCCCHPHRHRHRHHHDRHNHHSFDRERGRVVLLGFRRVHCLSEPQNALYEGAVDTGQRHVVPGVNLIRKSS